MGGAPNKVAISPATHSRLAKLASGWRESGVENLFQFEARELIDVPGEPEPVQTYFLQKSTWGRHYRMRMRANTHRTRRSVDDLYEDGVARSQSAITANLT